MKKLLSFLLVLTIVVGAVVAQGLGLTAGVELGFDGLNARRGEFESFFYIQTPLSSNNVTATQGGGDPINGATPLEGVYEITEPYLMPFVIFDRPFFNGGLDLFAEVDLRFGLYKDGYDATVDPSTATQLEDYRARNIDLLVDLQASNNLRISSSSTLSFILGTTNAFRLSPTVESGYVDTDDGLWKETADGGKLMGMITPGIKFKQGFGFGDLYLLADVPVSYHSLNGQPNLIYLGFSVGWESNFGLGVKIRELNLLAALGPNNPATIFYDDIKGVQGFGLTVSYNVNPALIELEVRIPRRMTFDGIRTSRTSLASGNEVVVDAPYLIYNESPAGLRQAGYPGITVVPRVEVGIFRGLQVYAEFIFEGFGASFDEDFSTIPIPVKHSQSYGVKYSF